MKVINCFLTFIKWFFYELSKYGDFVFVNNEPAAAGIYKLGFLDSMKFRGGRIIK